MTLLLKLVLAPLLVVGSSLAGRRWGPGVTGLLVALPVVAGPILVVTYLEHGAAFAARAASASLLGLVSLAVFSVVFAFVARARSWPVTLLTGWAACLAVDLGLSFTPVPAWVALVLAALVAWGAAKVVPAARGEARPVALPWWDLPARAVATAVLVVSLTAAAGRLGPDLTGVLAPFPVGTSVVAVFALVQGGPAAAVATTRGVLRGLGGFAAFCYLVAVLAEPIEGWAFLVAAAGVLVVQAGVSGASSPRRPRVRRRSG
ncbi:hypothetical protein VA596_29580 [Amycolatopsis sp., V23-08]|uniref:Uncharacterized protein n=1 Tax=Amycolatopsis heterodermiae TaxID=3110235 RepID=A0ABU5RBU5_9PSEU|nr:hypothetical protein [Amycolatopsis sp., V23-08]MEA5363717.1 hypothetical protein [Amycolatopsis sp., V23-08]